MNLSNTINEDEMDIEVRDSLAAMKRAAMLARKVAIQTDTGIVVMENNQLRYITAQELRSEVSAGNSDMTATELSVMK
jgi:hypothetical protein